MVGLEIILTFLFLLLYFWQIFLYCTVATLPMCKKKKGFRATLNQKVTLLNKRATDKEMSRCIILKDPPCKYASQSYPYFFLSQAGLLRYYQEGSSMDCFSYSRFNSVWAGHWLQQQMSPSWWGKYIWSGTFQQDSGEQGQGKKN